MSSRCFVPSHLVGHLRLDCVSSSTIARSCSTGVVSDNRGKSRASVGVRRSTAVSSKTIYLMRLSSILKPNPPLFNRRHVAVPSSLGEDIDNDGFVDGFNFLGCRSVLFGQFAAVDVTGKVAGPPHLSPMVSMDRHGWPLENQCLSVAVAVVNSPR